MPKESDKVKSEHSNNLLGHPFYFFNPTLKCIYESMFIHNFLKLFYLKVCMVRLKNILSYQFDQDHCYCNEENVFSLPTKLFVFI